MSIGKIRQLAVPAVRVVYRIPYMGYLARLIVAFVKLPRLNSQVRLLLERRGAGPINTLSGDSNTLAEAVQNMDEAWRHNLPLFLNAVSSVGAFGRKIAAIETGLQSVRDEVMQLKQERNLLQDEVAAQKARQAELLKRIDDLSRRDAVNIVHAKRVSGE